MEATQDVWNGYLTRFFFTASVHCHYRRPPCSDIPACILPLPCCSSIDRVYSVNMAGTKPRTRTSPAATRAPSALTRLYLFLYNSASLAGWSYVLYRLLDHLAGGTGSFQSLLPSSKHGLDAIISRASTAYSEVGDVTRLVQTGAVLEIVHVLLGLVRSGLGTTVAQVASRLILVWGVLLVFPQVNERISTPSMRPCQVTFTADSALVDMLSHSSSPRWLGRTDADFAHLLQHGVRLVRGRDGQVLDLRSRSVRNQALPARVAPVSCLQPFAVVVAMHPAEMTEAKLFKSLLRGEIPPQIHPLLHPLPPRSRIGGLPHLVLHTVGQAKVRTTRQHHDDAGPPHLASWWVYQRALSPFILLFS